MRGISLPAEKLLASQEEVCSMQLLTMRNIKWRHWWTRLYKKKLSNDMKLTARNSMLGCQLKEPHTDLRTAKGVRSKRTVWCQGHILSSQQYTLHIPLLLPVCLDSYSHSWRISSYIIYFKLHLNRARDGVFGWGTALQAGRSRFRFPMVSLGFFVGRVA